MTKNNSFYQHINYLAHTIIYCWSQRRIGFFPQIRYIYLSVICICIICIFGPNRCVTYGSGTCEFRSYVGQDRNLLEWDVGRTKGLGISRDGRHHLQRSRTFVSRLLDNSPVLFMMINTVVIGADPGISEQARSPRRGGIIGIRGLCCCPFTDLLIILW